MLTRRRFLKISGAVALWPASGCAKRASSPGLVLVNDVQSQLNATRVDLVGAARSPDDLEKLIRKARTDGKGISIAGGRHAMGGQQFGTDTILIDMTGMDRVLHFNREEGEIEVEAGIQWPALINYLVEAQSGQQRQWAIIQKQTGADRFSIGGALGSNIHGRGLRLQPFIADVQSFMLLDADGMLRRCDRRENAELFRLAIGGYGLFGIITSVRLRLAPRRKLRRVVEILHVDELMSAFEKRIADGFLYGDFQFSVDGDSDHFLRKGVFSCYQPVGEKTSMPEGQKELSEQDWRELIYLLHVNPSRAFEMYSRFYLASSGQIYWSDTHQLSLYIDTYHQWLDKTLGAKEKATEIITELYVPRQELTSFMAEASRDFREHDVQTIYGTIRLIERDEESFLGWAKEHYACVIFNLHTVHSPQGVEHSARAFRRLIDLAIGHRGSYYLTYHRFATRQQVETCYPQFPQFLALKRQYDPEERFQSDWYRHYKAMFPDVRQSTTGIESDSVPSSRKGFA